MSAAISEDVVRAMKSVDVASRMAHAVKTLVASLDCADKEARDGAVDILNVVSADLSEAIGELGVVLAALSKERTEAKAVQS